jgi:heme/copper-type cytochrome/quinol oxidase subunit 2
VTLSPEVSRIVFWLCIACCAFAQGAIVISTWKGIRSRAADRSASGGLRSNQREAPELLWAVLPVVALILVFVGTWQNITKVANADVPGPFEQEPSVVSGTPTLLAQHNLPLGRITITAAPRQPTARPAPVGTEHVMVESADPQEYRPQ